MAIAAIRTLIIYVVLVIAMRLMGRRQLGELQPIELVVTLIISDLAAVPMQDSGIPLASGLIPIAVLISAEILLSALMLKSRRFSSLVSGTPLVVIRDGVPDGNALRRLRMTVEDLSESLRGQQVFDIRDVQLAIAEPNGNVSVYPVAAKRPLVFEDVSPHPPRDHGMPLIVIADGKPCEWAMQILRITPSWIDSVLTAEHLTADDVMILSVNARRDYHLIPKEASL